VEQHSEPPNQFRSQRLTKQVPACIWIQFDEQCGRACDWIARSGELSFLLGSMLSLGVISALPDSGEL